MSEQRKRPEQMTFEPGQEAGLRGLAAEIEKECRIEPGEASEGKIAAPQEGNTR